MSRKPLLAVVLSLVACGGSVTTDQSDSGTDSGTDSGSDSGPSGGCPATPPSAAAACTRAGLQCEYGDDPRVECRTIATCTDAKWEITSPKCIGLPPETCPATREAAAGMDCTTKGAFCSYDGLACECTNCIKYPVERCDGPLKWACDAPNPDATCPAARPRLGTVCSSEGQQCNYGCENGVSRKCVGGVWTSASSPGGCPVSTRRAKKNIAYLSSVDVDALAAEALSLRLASWQYQDPALGAGPHVGIILEDDPNSFAVDKGKDMVDLYGYSTLALAAAQSQAKKIAALEAELAELRARLKKLEAR
ncbi:MAG: hypothetical protein ACXVEE_21580 [Polyangiales bacterium]